MNNCKIGNMQYIYDMYPKIYKLTEIGAEALEKNSLESFNNIRAIYIIERQVMFLDVDVDEITIKNNKNMAMVEKELDLKINEVISKIPYLDESNLAKEFNIQTISLYISKCKVKYIVSTSKSKKDAIDYMKMEAENNLKTGKFNINDIERAHLRKIKLEVMERLNIKESDFSMCFAPNSLIMSI